MNLVEQIQTMLDHRKAAIEKALADGDQWRFQIKRDDGAVVGIVITPSTT